MTILVLSHVLKITLPGDLSPEGTKSLLAVNLDQQSQARLDGRTFGAATAGAKSAGHQLVINNHIRSHHTPPLCVCSIHILACAVKTQRPRLTLRREATLACRRLLAPPWCCSFSRIFIVLLIANPAGRHSEDCASAKPAARCAPRIRDEECDEDLRSASTNLSILSARQRSMYNRKYFGMDRAFSRS